MSKDAEMSDRPEASAPGLPADQLAVLGIEPLTPDDPVRVDRYEVLGVLGSGGMGRVYLGRADGRLVAVKVVRAEFADSKEFRRRFARELEAVGRIGAAHTAALVDSQAEATRPWMATEFVPGVCLADASGPGRPLEPAAVWRLASGAADALGAIHRAGVVHRDLKPANVILALDGPKVIDFGVSRSLDLSQLTMTGQQIGTPSYMAPEQALAGTVNEASDIFGLGALLCFAATGAAPFGSGNPAEVTYRIVYQEPDLSALAAADGRLARLVERCLAKDPGDRPGAADLAAEIAEERLPSAWPPALRERIEPRTRMAASLSARAARTAPWEDSARSGDTHPGAGTGFDDAPGGGHTMVRAPGGLPVTPTEPVPNRRRRTVIAAATAASLVILAAAISSVLLSGPGASAKSRATAGGEHAGRTIPTATSAQGASSAKASAAPGGVVEAGLSPSPSAAGPTGSASPSASATQGSILPTIISSDGSITLPAGLGGALTGCSGTNTAYSFTGSCDGGGPTSYRAVAWCGNGTEAAYGIKRTDGDAGTSTATCGGYGGLGSQWGFFVCDSRVLIGYYSVHGATAGRLSADQPCSDETGEAVEVPVS
jgi:eukaryotic-like serine/threonine-protein kinase